MIQYGYVTLFVVAFPLTPLLALFNNLVEVRALAVAVMYTIAVAVAVINNAAGVHVDMLHANPREALP